MKAALGCVVLASSVLLLAGCPRGGQKAAGKPLVLAVESFLSDITLQISGDRMDVRPLIPVGVEPHSFEPTPRELALLTDAALVICSGSGLEAFLGKVFPSGSPRVVEASAGLAGRSAREGEAVEGTAGDTPGATDPHFYLDPLMVIRYTENIRDALIRLDPAGRAVYSANAEAYAEKLRELDRRISAEVARIPPAARMLVTNHESLGYFADRYGFRVVGTIIPSVSTEAAPTARQVARLVERLRSLRARAVFLETGANPQLARQVASEAGVAVVTELYTHSLSAPGGPAASYLAMMEYNAAAIVKALAPEGG